MRIYGATPRRVYRSVSQPRTRVHSRPPVPTEADENGFHRWPRDLPAANVVYRMNSAAIIVSTTAAKKSTPGPGSTVALRHAARVIMGRDEDDGNQALRCLQQILKVEAARAAQVDVQHQAIGSRLAPKIEKLSVEAKVPMACSADRRSRRTARTMSSSSSITQTRSSARLVIFRERWLWLRSRGASLAGDYGPRLAYHQPGGQVLRLHAACLAIWLEENDKPGFGVEINCDYAKRYAT